MAKFFDFNVDNESGDGKSNTMVFNQLGRRITEKINEQMATVRNGLLFVREPSMDNQEPQKTFMPFNMDPHAYSDGSKSVIDEFNKLQLHGDNSIKGGYDFSAIDPDLYDAVIGGDTISTMDANIRRHLSLKPGDCPVVNPNWQWGELDDVRSNPHSPLVGRVYLNDIMANYPIIIIEPGREKFNKNPFSFFGIGGGASTSNALNSYIRSGGEKNSAVIFKSFLALVTNVVLLPFTVIKGAIDLISGGEEAGKFIRFKNAMKLYNQMVNDVWREIAGNLNLLPLEINSTLSGQKKVEIPKPKFDDANGTVSYSDKDIEAQYSEYQQNGLLIEDIDDSDNAEDPNNRIHQDINNDSASKLTETLSKKNISYKGTWDFLNLQSILPNNAYSDQKSPFGLFNSKWSHAMMNAATKVYVPWLCTKSVSVNESFSNNTEDHPIAQQMNSISQEAHNEFGILGDTIKAAGESGLDMGQFVDKFKSTMLKNISSEVLKNTAELGLLLNGKGQALFPQVWSNSSYSRSINMSLKLFAPYGDTISIFENVMAQYAMWLVLSQPIQTAKNMYMSPFVIRATSRGLFSCEFGMVESLSVKRGEEKNDRNVVGLPRTISIDIGIKDLAPVMMMSLGGGMLWQFRAANTALSDYLGMICGLTMADRTMTLNKVKKSLNKVFGKVTEDLLNPHYWTRKVSDSIIGLPYRWWANSTGKIQLDKNIQYPGVGQ